MSAEERIKRLLTRLLAVPREDLESTHIVTGQPLSAMPQILGISGAETKVVDLSDRSAFGVLKTAIKEREMHAQQPLSSIAEPLGIEVRVRFYEINGIPVYFVQEPTVDDLAVRVYAYLRLRISETGLEGGNVLRKATELFRELGLDPKFVLSVPGVKAGIYYVWRDLVGYGPLEVMMEDPMVEEISWYSYDGPVLVVDKEVADKYPNAEFTYTNVFIPPSLDDETRKFVMSQIVRVIANKARVGLTVARPLAEARVPDPTGRGFHRLAAHLDVVGRSTGLTIRKFPQYKLSLTKLIDLGTLSELEAAYLLYQLLNRGFVLIVGGMASGKSVSARSMIAYRRRGRTRVGTIEGLWAELAAESRPIAVGEMEVIEAPDVEVLSLADGLRAEWRRPARLIRHRFSGRLYRIVTSSGAEVEVTADHSLLVYEGGRLVTRRPTELSGSERLPRLARLPVPDGGNGGEEVGLEGALDAPDDARAALVASLVEERGLARDGSIEVRGLSRERAYLLAYVLASLGVVADLSHGAGGYAVTARGGSGLELVARHLSPGVRRRVLRGLGRAEAAERDVVFDEVVRVEEVPYDGYVYDVEVPETENFEANGIFVHNTTLLQALISALPVSYKVITVEDTPELSTPSQNWHPLYTRTTMGETELENIDYSRLVIHSLRHRGTIVTLGEVRGAEMNQLIQAAASGHGAACTFHAHDPFSVLRRITAPPINVSPKSLELITSMVFLARTKTFAYGEPRAVRRVLKIYEIENVSGDEVKAPAVFEWDPATDTHHPDIFDREFEGLAAKGMHDAVLQKIVDGLARLWVSSKTVRTLGTNVYGEDEAERALADILALASFLYSERKAGVFDITSLSNDLTSFYLRMDERSAALWNKLHDPLLRRIEELMQEGK